MYCVYRNKNNTNMTMIYLNQTDLFSNRLSLMLLLFALCFTWTRMVAVAVANLGTFAPSYTEYTRCGNQLFFK